MHRRRGSFGFQTRALFGLVFLLSCGGGGSAPPDSPTERGALVSVRKIATFSAAQIAALIAPLDLQAASLAVQPVDTYVVVYGTPDTSGQIISASGSIMVPASRLALPMVSVQHGTVTSRTNVASASPSATSAGQMGLLMASSGYFVCLPDYQGFGASTTTHPYVHARSLAAAVIDLLIAAEKSAPGIQATLDGRLFLTGYSEGGYATLATHKEIEATYSNRFDLVASAPMAGPYDVSGTAKRLFALDTYPWPAYIAFLLTAYNEIYRWGDLSAIFKAPYAAMMSDLFDGSQGFTAVNGRLPTDLSQLLQGDFVAGVLDGSDTEVVGAFAENDLLGWSPLAPVRFYHGDADNAVPYENAQRAVSSLATGSNSVELVTISGGTHESTALPALLGMIRWFQEL